MSAHGKYCKADGRAARLEEIKQVKMAASSHVFVRGNTQKFYEWLETADPVKIPEGPPIWICGDCHVGNLGPIANAKGDVDIQIRDLDQTVIGNPAHDLIRLGLSLATAARGSDLPGIITVKILESLIQGYETALLKIKKPGIVGIKMPKAVRGALKTALSRNWKDMAVDRIQSDEPIIHLGKKFWPLSKAERQEMKRLFADEKVRRLATALSCRDDDSSVEVRDAAFWVKGCSSLGRLRYAAVLAVDGKDSDCCLIDIKEAVVAAAPRQKKVKMPADQGERVAVGAWHLSPALGNRMVASHFLGRPVFLRELLPQDLKFEIKHLAPQDAVEVAKYLAFVVGKAHGRQMDDRTRKRWCQILAGNRGTKPGVPSWLWTSVVELMVIHEEGYLEHCHKYARLAAEA